MDQIINDVDIAICGAGPVGQTLALLLHQQGYKADRIALFDGKTAEQAGHDARSIALSYGSRQILQAAGAWPIKATSISEIHVSRRGHFGRSLMRASDYDLPALGYVARYGDIIRPLQQAITQSGISITRPYTITAIDEMPDHVRLSLLHSDTMSTQAITHISAGIVIQAEGGTFGEQQQRTQHHDYQQTAIIAHVNTDAQITGRAFERFTEQGPLALLPHEDGYALVWCVRPDQAGHLLALDEAAFRQALQTAFGNRLGNFIKTSARLSYPLGLNAQAQATARTVTIGNAAQTLHPVAGQGLNLGLRDSVVLARTLAAMTDPATALQAYLAERQADRKLTIRITDSMARVFASAPDGAFSQTLLGMGLGALDLIKPAKKMLAEQMMYGWR
ncbi:FAD-dependent monooxygenase [Undibacterium sp. Ji50W]|uniref:FAD-dependent monooxygenase n=1 Tax=Undibacterium sp. Ji50W TaxID=3413041 RepID=UPI003BF149BA